MAKVHNQVPTPNASLLRQQPDEKISLIKQQTSKESISDQIIEGDFSPKDVTRDNFSELVMTRMQPNYSLQQTSSVQNELMDGTSGRVGSSNYQNFQIGTRISLEDQNIGSRDISRDSNYYLP